MKKTFISLFSALVAVVIMSSCLGEGGDNTYSGTREFGVVNVGDGIKQALMASGYIITGDDIDNYSSGDIILATYKVNSANYINNTTIKVDYATVDDANDAYTNSKQKSVITESNYTFTANADNSFTGISAQYGYSTEYFMNRWLIAVSAVVKKDQDITSINLYYNKDNQVIKDGPVLPDDAIVLDVELLKTTSPSGTTETTTKTKYVGVDLTGLRKLDIKGMENSSTTKTMNIWLRFPKYTSSAATQYAPGIVQKAMGLTYVSDSN